VAGSESERPIVFAEGKFKVLTLSEPGGTEVQSK
jgi:hypothetical protein